MPDSKVVEALVDAVHAAEEMMDHGRGLTARGAEWRAESITMLRQTMTVAEIAHRLNVTPSAIYAVLNEGAEASRPVWFPPADRRIAQNEDTGRWTFFCPSHQPGYPVIAEFPNQVLAEQFMVEHDRAVHGVGLS